MDPKDLELDDELTREKAFTEGPKKVLSFILRPVTALSMSWLQRNFVFGDGFGDMLQKTAAFAFLHTAEKNLIRSVVNDRAEFSDAVDEWMDTHFRHHKELEPLATQMNEALDFYMASTSTAANPNNGTAPAKN